MPSRAPRRLYLRLYFAFLGVLLAVSVVSAAISFFFTRAFAGFVHRGPRAAEYLARSLPPAEDARELTRAVARLHEELGLDVAVFDVRGVRLAEAGAPLPAPSDAMLARAKFAPSWLGRGIAIAPLRAGSGGPAKGVLVVRLGPPEGTRIFRLLLALAGTLLVSLALVYPLSRSITRPLERLTAAAEAFGKGDLAARSGVRGDDEVGRLARSFDEMADRIQAARRAEKELLANVSHELRTPLARIRVALELVEAQDDALRRRIAVVAEELDELERLVADVLTATKLDLAALPLRRVRLQAQELVEKVRQRALALEPGQPVEADVQPGLELLADEALLSRALDNLVDNARKYAGANGRPIRIEARASAGGGAVLAVSDGGPGIPPAELERVFDPFFRGGGSRGSAPGFGLGLALARRVAEAHGGSIRATNVEGGGARIELRLPAPA